ncbi:type ISP restriction/modification enzyme, partial [Acetobacter orleanensis]
PYGNEENFLICIKARVPDDGFFVIMTNNIFDLQSDGGTQCFPLFVYHENKNTSDHPDLLTDSSKGRLTRQDAITDEGLKHFQDAYPGRVINKEDLFYYVYGLLHSPEYRERYADTLRKELPRIPRVKTYETFRAFSDAGRRLGEMHVNFDSQPIYEGVKIDYGKGPLTPEAFRVEKMKYGKGKDKSILHYNDRITVIGIPLKAYDYVVNGKSALDWVVERQCVKTDKASGIVNDANDWAIETMDNPRYPLELFLRVITISLETMKIVNGLPPLDILES